MASGVNKAILVGNLGADPELRYTNGGTAVCELRLATNESYKDREGNRKESTEWHRVIVWDKRAEVVSKHLAKGRQVYVEGKIRTRSWEDREGSKRQATEIVATDVQFLQGGSQQPSQPQGGGGGPAYEPGPDEDIPFVSIIDPTHNPGRRAV